MRTSSPVPFSGGIHSVTGDYRIRKKMTEKETHVRDA